MNSSDHFSRQKRLIGYFIGKPTQPTLVIFSGIHGNEAAGVKASKKVINKITEDGILLKGNLFLSTVIRKPLS